MLEYIERFNYPEKTPELVVIWLHGLGADYNDFVPLVNELNLTKSVRFIFPNAPLIPITINGGHIMRGWYDIKSIDKIDVDTDVAGIEKSYIAINAIVENLIRQGYESQKIVIAGFSQGGVMSYVMAIKSPHKFAGIIALSCYLPVLHPNAFASKVNQTTPILSCHGSFDQIVPVIAGKWAFQALTQAGFNNMQWLEYPMEHSVCNEEVAAIRSWFDKR